MRQEISTLSARGGLFSAYAVGAIRHFFASYGELSVQADELTQFFDVYRLFGPPGETLAERYEVDGKPIRILSFGVNYDPGSWFVEGEWAKFSSSTL
ncbi:hypothetical protein DK37_07490, partial [Halomonas sp. SUBG004]